MQPSPSVSISAIMRCTSSAEVDPSVRSASVSSDSEILPSPLVSNRLKIRSMSAVSAIIASRPGRYIMWQRSVSGAPRYDH
ncbi:hypothetical protein SETIT_6G251000v2 [Setaria italica]|uniref:Uncharacterized protein n=1 Tax=Setaria italica TaxID=4555 RepID=A0A368RQ70_SETIT|nr:hypothetical protein SETIT_6G251000v2 [Setaria italica]